jgi:aminodeoxyfutalosine synthase
MGGVLEVASTSAIDFSDPALPPIWDKVRAGQRLDADDGLRLFETDDLLGLGRMADFVKRQRCGDWVYFVVNRQVNPSNLCVLSCSFCDFARRRGEEGAYEMSLDQILGLIDDDVHEVHIVGGHHPDWPFEYYEEMLRAIRDRFPRVQLKAFTAAEMDYFSKRFKLPVKAVLARLQGAGLQSMPGGGAEVFSERVRKLLFPGKASARRWLEIHRLAHQMRIKSNCSLLYGHIETYEERVRHLLLLRDLQDETGGFLAFIPLEYQTGDTNLVPRQASAFDDLKTVAVSRLLLDNVPHIKAYWVMMGEETASMALHFGASDLDGTIGEERVAHAARAQSPAGLARERIIRLIRDAGRTPVERDALYNAVRVYDA